MSAYKLEHLYPRSGNRLSLERRGFIHKVISQKVLGTCAGTYLGTCAGTYAGTCAGTYQGPVQGPSASVMIKHCLGVVEITL